MKPVTTAQEAIEAAAQVVRDFGDMPKKRRWVPRSEVAAAISATPVEEDNLKAKADKLAEALQYLVDLDDMPTTAAMEQDGIDKALAALAEYKADQPNEATHRQRGRYTGGV